MAQAQRGQPSATLVIESWPQESRGAAQLVIDQYGEPDEVTETRLIWHRSGPWKRMVATKAFYDHHFPAPHIHIERGNDAAEGVMRGNPIRQRQQRR